MSRLGLLGLALGPLVVSLVGVGCQGEASLRLKKGLEPQFERVLTTQEGELPAGWEWQTAAVQEDRVQASFGPTGETWASCEQAACCLELIASSASQGADRVAGEFAIHGSSGRCTGDLAMDQRLISGIASRLEDVFGGAGGQESPWQVLQADLGWAQVMARVLAPRWVLLASLVLLLAALALDWKRVSWSWVGLGGVLVLGGWLASWLLVPHATLHDNHHGYTFLMIAQSVRPPAHHTLSSFLSTMQVLVRALVWLGVDGDEAFYGVNTLFAALCGPLMGLWVFAWTGRKAAGVLASVMWLASPMVLRLGPTDSFFSWCTLLFAGSALLWAHGLKQLPTRPLVGGLCVVGAAGAAVLLGQAHVMALLLVPAVLPLALSLGLPTVRRQWVALGGTLLGVAACLIPQALAIWQGAAQREGGLFVEVSSLVSWASWVQRMSWNGDWVSPVVPLAGLVGIVMLVRKARLTGALVAVAFATVLAGELLVFMCLTFHVSSETPQVWLATALAAVGGWKVIEWLGRRIPHGQRGWQVAGGLSLLTGVVVPPSDILQFLPPSGQEYRYLRDEVFPYLRQNRASELLFVGSERVEGFHRMPVPLEWLRKELPGVAVRSSGALWKAETGGSDRGARFIYHGLSCLETLPTYPICESVPCSRLEPVPAQAALLAPHCRTELAGLASKPVMERSFANVTPCFLCVGYPAKGLWGTLTQFDPKD